MPHPAADNPFSPQIVLLCFAGALLFPLRYPQVIFIKNSGRRNKLELSKIARCDFSAKFYILGGKMNDLERIGEFVKQYTSPQAGRDFFQKLGYRTIDPLPFEIDDLPEKAREPIASVHQLVSVEDLSSFRVYHIQLNTPTAKRSQIRYFLEAFYRRYPQGENLFVFSARDNYDELLFISPRRLQDPRDPMKIRLWLRILPVRRENPYRTDREVLAGIQVKPDYTAEKIWELHEQAFSVQRVSRQFFEDYRRIFDEIRNRLQKSNPENDAEWARDYTHTLLNRIMFLYFVARKSVLKGPDGGYDRDFMRHFWEAYKQSGQKDAFHRDWLSVLFFEVFNRKWQSRAEYRKRFPEWVIRSFSDAVHLNGGLYRRTRLDEQLFNYLPDEVFAYLFDRWYDGTFPGLFERYNFTVVETSRFDEEVAVDPEMLGTVYERLVNITYEEDLQAGIFYTPRTEIDLMCRLSLVDWLSNQIGEEHKDLLYRWVFAFSEEEKEASGDEITALNLWKRLDELIRRVRVCDPACGSGSFLVGMLLVLDDLQERCNKTFGRDETPYARRKRILRDQLYGVDVMEWAVRVAELRLWLQLVVETEIKLPEYYLKPVLPNLNFKIRPGDSLLQTIGDLDFSPFRRADLEIPAHLKGRITKLQGKKRRFFLGEPGIREEELRREEQQLFREILAERIHRIEKEIQHLEHSKRTLTDSQFIPTIGDGRMAHKREQIRSIEEQISRLRDQRERLVKAREAIKPDQPTPFVWDIAFVEIFEGDSPGFDIIIGNPPYVRQEKIRDYLGRFSRKEYIDRLNEGLRTIYPAFMTKIRRIGGRADYYIYFYLHGMSLLADGGSFCFITSNSWLDVDFGKYLQEFFVRFGHLKMVIDNQKKRSFSHADVNTVIVLAGVPERKRPLSEAQMKKRPVRFIAFKVPFEKTLNPVVFMEIEDEKQYKPRAHFRVLARPEFRSVMIDQWTLYREGLAQEEKDGQLVETDRYEGDKWGGKYLRAPDVFFTILEKGRGKLVRLGEIAEVRYGIKTGANDFFYLQPVDLTVKQVAELAERDPMAPVRVRNGAGWEGEIEAGWLRPVIKSPREIKTIRVRLEDLHYLVLMPPEDVRRAIERGNKQPWRGYPQGSGVYSLG
ncbi:MAG TPA: hypothetical protein ENG11_01290 [candidate division Zixibacteria bacterium]|nr:hypothetical protein [candidate division Zixibacteria bacterium]